jgi:hypothetical protein
MDPSGPIRSGNINETKTRELKKRGMTWQERTQLHLAFTKTGATSKEQ